MRCVEFEIKHFKKCLGDAERKNEHIEDESKANIKRALYETVVLNVEVAKLIIEKKALLSELRKKNRQSASCTSPARRSEDLREKKSTNSSSSSPRGDQRSNSSYDHAYGQAQGSINDGTLKRIYTSISELKRQLEMTSLTSDLQRLNESSCGERQRLLEEKVREIKSRCMCFVEEAKASCEKSHVSGRSERD